MSLAGRVLMGLDPLLQTFLFLSRALLEDGVLAHLQADKDYLPSALYFYRSSNYRAVTPFLETTKRQTCSSNTGLRGVLSDVRIDCNLHDRRSSFRRLFLLDHTDKCDSGASRTPQRQLKLKLGLGAVAHCPCPPLPLTLIVPYFSSLPPHTHF